MVLSEPTTHKASEDALRTKVGLSFIMKNAVMENLARLQMRGYRIPGQLRKHAVQIRK